MESNADNPEMGQPAPSSVESKEALQLAVDSARITGDGQTEADAHVRLGNLAWSKGDHQTARESFERSLTLRRQLGDRKGEANCLNMLAGVSFMEEDFTAAAEVCRQSLAIKRDLGDRTGEAHALLNLGTAALNLRDQAGAELYYAQSLGLSRELADTNLPAEICVTVGTAFASFKNWESAALILYSCRKFATTFEPTSPAHKILNEGFSNLDEAVQAGDISAADLEDWKAQGESMDPDQLVEYTQAALKASGASTPHVG